MKQLQISIKAICALLGVILIVSSCSSSKKTAISCPELPGYHNAQKVAIHQNRHNQHLFAFSGKDRKHKGSSASHSKSLAKEHSKYLKVQNETNSSALTLSESLPENFSELNRKEFKNNLLASADNSILPVVKTSSENNETSLKQDHVTASSISEKSRMETERITNSQEKPVKIQPLAIAGLIAGIVGLFIAGIPLGIIAVIFGIIALNKIKKNPDIFRGKGLSIASVILGFIAIIGAIIVLSM